jgi:site-specific DNA recombinase
LTDDSPARILTNPIYIGRVAHKAASHPGRHPAIIDKALWDAVQAQLTLNVQGTRNRRRRAAERKSLLAGILVTANGNGFVDNHANKGSRRYRYYVEERAAGATRLATRLPATDFENVVSAAVIEFLRDRGSLLSNLPDLARAEMKPAAERAEILANELETAKAPERATRLRPLLHRIVYREDALRVELGSDTLRDALGIAKAVLARGGNRRPEDDLPVVLNAPLLVRRRGRQLRLLLGEGLRPTEPDLPVITVVARAHVWVQSLISGEVRSVTEIAKRENVSATYVSQLLPIGFLAPAVVEAILNGHQPVTLTADRLVRRERVVGSWSRQVEFGSDP